MLADIRWGLLLVVSIKTVLTVSSKVYLSASFNY